MLSARRCAWPLAASLFAAGVAGLGSICPLPWNENDSEPDHIDLSIECPHGHRFPIPKFDTTIPNDPTITDWICVFYGALPFVVIFLSILHTLRDACQRRCFGTRELSFLGFVLISVGINELIFKRIVRQPRPEKSCQISCGFPSGHSTMAMGFFTLMLCDAVFRVRPKLPMDVDHAQMEAAFQKQHVSKSRWDLIKQEGRVMIHVIPLSRADILGPAEFLSFVGTWGLALLPVPFSRVVLNDHTAMQVMFGSFVGTVEAICWFSFVRNSLQVKYNDRLGSVFCWGLVMHNHALPRFDVHAKCCRLLARMLNKAQGANFTVTFASHDEDMQGLESMRTEIQWYLDQDKHSIMPSMEDKIYTLIEDTNLLKLKQSVDDVIESDGDVQCLSPRSRQSAGGTASLWGSDFTVRDSSRPRGRDSSLRPPIVHTAIKSAKTTEMTNHWKNVESRPPAHWRLDGGRRGLVGATKLFS